MDNRPACPMPVGANDPVQIHGVHNLNDKTGKMALWKQILNRRRQESCLVAFGPLKSDRHNITLQMRLDTVNTTIYCMKCKEITRNR